MVDGGVTQAQGGLDLPWPYLELQRVNNERCLLYDSRPFAQLVNEVGSRQVLANTHASFPTFPCIDDCVCTHIT